MKVLQGRWNVILNLLMGLQDLRFWKLLLFSPNVTLEGLILDHPVIIRAKKAKVSGGIVPKIRLRYIFRNKFMNKAGYFTPVI